MIVYRLAKQRFNALDGEGARLYPGRWNTHKHKALYTSANSSLAILEVIVNIQKYKLLYEEPYVIIALDVPDDPILDLRNDPDILKVGFKNYDLMNSMGKGSMLLNDPDLLGFIVPSIVNPIETNIILNASAFDLEKFRVTETLVDFDPRFEK
jgi:RES domain-containing protein